MSQTGAKNKKNITISPQRSQRAQRWLKAKDIGRVLKDSFGCHCDPALAGEAISSLMK